MTLFNKHVAEAIENDTWFKSTEGEWFSPTEMVGLMRTPGYKYFPENWTLQDPQIRVAQLRDAFNNALKENQEAGRYAVKHKGSGDAMEAYDNTILALIQAMTAYIDFKMRTKTNLE